MPLQTITIQSSVDFRVVECEEVMICLPADPWAGRTVSGNAFIEATVGESGRPLGGRGYVPRFSNPRNSAVYQYSVTYDDAQLNNDPETSAPYVIPCDEVSLSPKVMSLA